MHIRKLARSINLSLKPNLAWQLGAALGLGILLGAALQIIGPILVLMALGGVLIVCLAFMAPEIIILILLAFVLELIPPHFNINISLFVGHFFVTDILLVMLLAVILVRMLVDKTYRPARTPLDIPLLLFFGAAILGVVTAVREHGIPFSHVTPDVRVYMYYLIFFAVTNLIKTRSQLTRLINGILLMTVIIAVTMVIQAMLGRSYLIFSRASSVQGVDVIRIFTPGFVACYIALMTLIVDMALRKEQRSRFVCYLLILLLGLAIVTTVSRNLLVSLVITLGLLVLILRKSELSRFTSSLVIIAGIALFGIAVLMLFGGADRLLQYVASFFNRTSNMLSGTILTSQENVLIRWDEIKFAWQQLMEHPVLGIGFRTPYRPVFYLGDRLTHFLHNAYLSIWLKTGIFGLIFFVWLSLKFLVRGFRHWRVQQDSFFRAVTFSFTLAYIGLMLSNLVAPTFVQDNSAMIFGVIMGINEVVFAQNKANVKT